jgi:L-threonylcarbamoyladenylate synthase
MLKTNNLNDPRIIKLINNGAIGIIPTDTVYGLICSANNEKAVQRLYALKNREKKPGTIIAASINQLVDLGIKARYLKAVEHYWPNPVSVDIPHNITYLNQNTGRQAFRIPDHKILLKLLSSVGALQTTSANHPGEPEANTIQEAHDYFGDKVDFYIDGGDLSGRKTSTLIRIVDDAVEVLREGAITIKEDGTIAKDQQ